MQILHLKFDYASEIVRHLSWRSTAGMYRIHDRVYHTQTISIKRFEFNFQYNQPKYSSAIVTFYNLVATENFSNMWLYSHFDLAT